MSLLWRENQLCLKEQELLCFWHCNRMFLSRNKNKWEEEMSQTRKSIIFVKGIREQNVYLRLKTGNGINDWRGLERFWVGTLHCLEYFPFKVFACTVYFWISIMKGLVLTYSTSSSNSSLLFLVSIWFKSLWILHDKLIWFVCFGVLYICFHFTC